MIKVYNKLVRDKIPEIIIADGKTPVTRKITDKNEIAVFLIDKLDEEVQEYKDTGDPNELADILEVIRAIAQHFHNLDPLMLEQIRSEKEVVRGGFGELCYLEKVTKLNKS